jgi:hypothetical protein
MHVLGRCVDVQAREKLIFDKSAHVIQSDSITALKIDIPYIGTLVINAMPEARAGHMISVDVRGAAGIRVLPSTYVHHKLPRYVSHLRIYGISRRFISVKKMAQPKTRDSRVEGMKRRRVERAKTPQCGHTLDKTTKSLKIFAVMCAVPLDKLECRTAGCAVSAADPLYPLFPRN